MKQLSLVALAGDGIGPEIMAATLKVVAAAQKLFDLNLDIEPVESGFSSLERHGNTLPDATVERLRRADGIILGPSDTKAYPPPDQGGTNPSAKLRVSLQLYANMRPSRTFAGVQSVVPQMDLLIARENTEGFMADRNMFMGAGEFMPVPGVALAVRKITAIGSRRIAVAACEAAMKRRKCLAIVTKSNVLKMSDGLFLAEVKAVAAQYPELAVEEVLVDAMSYMLARRPDMFDVIVTTNLFGDILSNEAAGLACGLGMAGSLNMGDEHAMAQSSHGSAPRLAGKMIANPCSLLFSTCMLFDWLASRHQMPVLGQAAAAIDAAITRVIQAPGSRTRDLGGPLGTLEFADAVVQALGATAR